jgi:putative ABC transport system permease protein
MIALATRSSLAEAFSVALMSLRGSKLRSFLTLLGIILATTTLMAVMAVIHGMDVYIAEQVSDMGSDGFKIRRLAMIGEFNPKKLKEMERRNPELTREEFRFLKANAKLIRELGMENGRMASLRVGSESVRDVWLRGVTANMGVITNTQPAQGRFLTESEDQRRSEVVFIGEDIREKFFSGGEAVGKNLSIDGRPYRVVGVAAKLGSVFGQSRDNFVMIPMETYCKAYGCLRGLGFTALALDRAHLNVAQDEIRQLLRARRHVPPREEDNFSMFASDTLVAAWDRLTGVIAVTAMAVVSIFMVVGGVVIMNIMLAVVTERTHEIGIRKSVGARRTDIMQQFLLESSLLAGCGGLVGVGLAYLLAAIVKAATPVPVEMPVSSVFVSVGLSTVVGLFFGVYPAKRAAALDPIEALRFEI